MCANTQLCEEDHLDFVRYGQAFLLMRCLSNYLITKELNIHIVPVIIAGYFGGGPESSPFHLIHGRKYYLTKDSGRTKTTDNPLCYKDKKAQDYFKFIE